MGWELEAECQGAPGHWFFPEPGQQPIGVFLCKRCPVAEECRTYAEQNDLQGLWGGTAERERTRWGRRKLSSVSRDGDWGERVCVFCRNTYTATSMTQTICSDQCRTWSLRVSRHNSHIRYQQRLREQTA
jgi:hypothetical protein